MNREPMMLKRISTNQMWSGMAVLCLLPVFSNQTVAQIPATIYSVSSNLKDVSGFDRTAEHVVNGAGFFCGDAFYQSRRDDVAEQRNVCRQMTWNLRLHLILVPSNRSAV
ncbi:MAG: hypothetical protein R3C28_32625 [Pirellulaceae bacterium]